MFTRGIRKYTVIEAMWWAGAFISAAGLLALPSRSGELDVSLRSPFENTGSGHAEQWIFLREAAEHVSRGSSYTVLAPDRDTEMSLYMMSVGLLPEALPLPSSYYSQTTEAGGRARFVLEYGDLGDQRSNETQVTTVTGGRLMERRAHTK